MAKKKAKKNESNPIVPIAAGGGILLVALGGLALVSNPPGGMQININNDDPAVVDILEALNYRDGDYYTTAEYYVPVAEKTDKVGISLSVRDGKIESVNVVMLKDDEIVENPYLVKYNDQLREIIVGKEVKDVPDLDLVSGSTITNDAFKEALSSLKQI